VAVLNSYSTDGRPCLDVLCLAMRAVTMAIDITETNKAQFVRLGVQNRTFGPYLAAMHRIRIPVMRGSTDRG
jgi:hypothetical protein